MGGFGAIDVGCELVVDRAGLTESHVRPKGDKLDDAPPTRHGLERPPKTTTQAERPTMKSNYPRGGALALCPGAIIRA